MKRNLLYVLGIIFFMASCSQEEEMAVQIEKQELEPMSAKAINAAIKEQIEATGTFDWNKASDHLLWSAAMHGDKILTIGYGDVSFDLHKSAKLASIKEDIILKVERMEIENSDKPETRVLYENDLLTYIDVKVEKLETIQELRKSGDIRYIEPSGYRFYDHENMLKSDSGCDKSADAINSADYRLVAPNAYVSWVLDRHNIPAAWNHSTGAGITVGLIDTGVSSEQELLNSQFNDGYSSGRYIYRYGTFVDSWWPWSTKTDGPWDKCSHGTSMASTIASPRNNNYQPVGVAYNCNFVSYRGTGDVVLDGYHEQNGVANALNALANRSDVRIISMSIGHIFSIGKIADAVRYAHSRGKLIFAAGGTSTNFTNWAGVIFPASMDETVAVTGITDGSGYEECAVCHKGSKIDFTVVMQRDWDDSRTSPTAGFYTGGKQYVGGSSVSTATTAGIAALVWAKYPSWNRDQVLQRLKESADLYPSKSSDFGYGSIDALLAVQ